MSRFFKVVVLNVKGALAPLLPHANKSLYRVGLVVWQWVGLT